METVKRSLVANTVESALTRGLSGTQCASLDESTERNQWHTGKMTTPVDGKAAAGLLLGPLLKALVLNAEVGTSDSDHGGEGSDSRKYSPHTRSGESASIPSFSSSETPMLSSQSSKFASTTSSQWNTALRLVLRFLIASSPEVCTLSSAACGSNEL